MSPASGSPPSRPTRLHPEHDPNLDPNHNLDPSCTGKPSGKESLLGVAPESSSGGGRWKKKGLVGAANAMDFGFWRDEHLDGGGGWLDAPLCASRTQTLNPDPVQTLSRDLLFTQNHGFWRHEHLDGGGGWLDAPVSDP